MPPQATTKREEHVCIWRTALKLGVSSQVVQEAYRKVCGVAASSHNNAYPTSQAKQVEDYLLAQQKEGKDK